MRKLQVSMEHLSPVSKAFRQHDNVVVAIATSYVPAQFSAARPTTRIIREGFRVSPLLHTETCPMTGSVELHQ